MKDHKVLEELSQRDSSPSRCVSLLVAGASTTNDDDVLEKAMTKEEVADDDDGRQEEQQMMTPAMMGEPSKVREEVGTDTKQGKEKVEERVKGDTVSSVTARPKEEETRAITRQTEDETILTSEPATPVTQITQNFVESLLHNELAIEPLPPSLPPFRRHEHHDESSEIPGAFAVRVFSQTRRRAVEPSSSLSPLDLEEAPRTQDSQQDIENDTSGLASAYPVVEDEVMALAEQMEVPTPAQEEEKKRKELLLRRRCIRVVAVLIVLILLFGAFVGFRLRNNGTSGTDDDDDGSSSNFPSSKAAAPSPAPSSVGISSNGVLAGLLETVPDYTLESLKQPLSPQSLAYEWLMNHRNITFLPEWRKIQLFALATFYHSFEGPSWPEHIQRSWMDDSVEECNWFSSNHGYYNEDGLFVPGLLPVYNGNSTFYFCNATTGRVADLTLEGLKLAPPKQPKLPPEVILLTSLQYLYFPSSEIGGTIDDLIPPNFYSTSWKGSISLYDNSLTGTIPTMFGLMSALHYLDLSANYLTGPIPSQIGAMMGAASLELYSNHLSGHIPSEIAELDALTVLDIDDNDLTGVLPTFLSKMTSLESLWLAGSAYSGKIPTQIGLLSRLHTLQLSGNDHLTGTIPSELGMMKDLVRLGLGDLLLTGSIPRELVLCTNLVEVNFNGSSHLSGTVPASLCSLQDPTCSRYFPYLEENRDCFLNFDCSDFFCGCDCECGSEVVLGNHTT